VQNIYFVLGLHLFLHVKVINMDGVMDKWTNPQIHYYPENDFF